MTIAVRELAGSDELHWREMWASYLRFYDVQLACTVSDATWQRILDPASAFRGRGAFADGLLVGFAITVRHESTWSTAPSCYLEDLFVSEASRSSGAGAALLKHVWHECVEQGYARLSWHTHKDNATARRLYDRFARADDFVRYRMTVER